MPNLILQGIDADEFRESVVGDLLSALKPLLQQSLALDLAQERCAGRERMATILGWSVGKLDRRTAAGAIPSIMDEGRRVYVVDEVLAALKAATPAAEAKAAERQAAKQAAKRKKGSVPSE